MSFFTHYSQLIGVQPVMPFDMQNIALIIIGLISAIIPLCLAIPLNENARHKALAFWVGMIVFLELSRQVWAISLGSYDFSEMLPLHLCGLQIFLMPIMLKTKHRSWRTFVYLTAMIGSLAAIFFNEGILERYPLWHFQSLQSFVIHGLIMMVPLYDIIWFKYRPSFKELPFSMLLLLYLAIQSYIINIFTGGNYLFVTFAPRNTPLEIVSSIVGPQLYVPTMYVVIVIIWSLQLLVFKPRRKIV